MNMKKTLVLAVILLAAFLYMKEFAIPSHEQSATKNVILAGMRPAELERVRVERKQPESSVREVFEVRSLGLKKAEPAAGAQKESEKAGVDDEGFGDISWELEQVPGAALDKTAVNTMVSSIKALDVEVRYRIANSTKISLFMDSISRLSSYRCTAKGPIRSRSPSVRGTSTFSSDMQKFREEPVFFSSMMESL